jgi:cytochrome P450
MNSLAAPTSFCSGVPHERFSAMRRDEPVAWVTEPELLRRSGTRTVSMKGSGFWALTRYEDVVAAARAPGLFSSALRGTFIADPVTANDLAQTRQFLINMDGPDHKRLRRLAGEAFKPKAIQRMTERIRGHAQALVDRAVSMGRFDGVRDLAAELPLLVLADMLGIPPQDRSLLLEWSTNLVGFDDPDYGGGDVRRYKQTFVDAFAYGSDLIGRRREAPEDDVISRLVHAEPGHGRPSHAELLHFWLLLVVAGNESTRHFLSSSLSVLLEHPAQRARLAANPELIPSAVEELLRYVSPVMQFRRTLTRDTEIHGRTLRRGDKVVLYFASANRDAEVFDEPDTLDLARSPNPHVAFGAGPHWCLGAHLARAEASALLEALLPHLRTIRSAGEPTRLVSNFMSGYKSLPIRVDEDETV